MHYAEDRERSAEVLRLTLGFMGRQKAALNPCSYAIWYEHCAGLNPALSAALEAHLAAEDSLTDQDVFRIYTEHILSRDIQTYEGMREQLYRILNDTTANTQVAGERALAYDQALASHAAGLTERTDGRAVKGTVQDLLSETSKMRAMTADLAARLQASTAEVSVLTESLLRAKSEALLALVDALTQLKNRRGFERAAEELTREHGSLAGTALMLVDLDHFKVVNDTHGHLLGDKVLRAVAYVLQASVKGRDSAARIGGEEFAVLLPQTTAAGALALGEQLRTQISRGRITRLDGQGLIGQVTVSIGIAIARSGDSLETLMARADAALYSAKRAGRNRLALKED